jgi:hypothetical protein
MATDFLFIEYTDFEKWEIYISDNEKDENIEFQAADIITSEKAIKRRRPLNQIEETKKV